MKKKVKKIYSWDELPVIFGTEEASILLNTSVNTIKVWAGNKTIPAFKFGRNWQFRKEDLMSFIEEATK